MHCEHGELWTGMNLPTQTEVDETEPCDMMSAVGANLRTRFQGCLVGAVIGDCLGAPFEMTGSGGSSRYVKRFAEKIPTKAAGSLQYTDDTAMARSVAASLIHNDGKFMARDMAKRFAEEYDKEPGRGYGGSVIDVFAALGDDKTDDIFSPARKQFDGSGSYGNGGAMRVAPVALCMQERFIQMIEVAKESAQLTHANALGYNGAILQTCAVHLALHADPRTFKAKEYEDKLLGIMASQEQSKDADSSDVYSSSEDTDDEVSGPKLKRLRKTYDRGSPGKRKEGIYRKKLRLMKQYLKQKGDVTMGEVAMELGNEISAHNSVPTAIYTFLHCMEPVKDFLEHKPFERTILYAITLDGDTDTIASMAGAIAGAYYGIDAVPESWMKACEGVDDAIQMADKLYDIMVK